MRAEDFIRRYPELYHVAGVDAWPSIASRGLFSASAALDHFGILGSARWRFEAIQRDTCMSLYPGHPSDIVLRDQAHMPREKLLEVLAGTGLAPQDWYQFMNAKVFFWSSRPVLFRYLRLPENRKNEHDVLVIDTVSLTSLYQARISLSPIDMRIALPGIIARDRPIFRPIAEYPAHRTGRPVRKVVEVAVDDSVHDIAQHVSHVFRTRGPAFQHRIF
jgi:hypothetical protein